MPNLETRARLRLRRECSPGTVLALIAAAREALHDVPRLQKAQAELGTRALVAEAERDQLRARVGELETELKRWRCGHVLQAFQEDHEHEVLTAYEKIAELERELAEATAIGKNVKEPSDAA